MNTERLQEFVDLARAASPQRWRLGFLAVASATSAAVAAGFGAGPFLVLMVVVPAIVATVSAGSHTAIAVIVIIIVEWIGSGGAVTSPAALIIALGLFVFHAVLSLLAVTPHSAALPPTVLRRWVQRSAVVSGATIALWAFVVVLEQREPPPDGVLLVLALAVLVAATTAARSRSLT